MHNVIFDQKVNRDQVVDVECSECIYREQISVWQSLMGIYHTLLPCGCEIESYLGYTSDSKTFPCVAHGGNPVAVAGRQAKRWSGPSNPYADPESCSDSENFDGKRLAHIKE